MNMKSDLTCFLSELQQKAFQGDYVFRGERMAKGRGGHELPVTSSLYRWVQVNATSGRDVPCHRTCRTGGNLPILHGADSESVDLIFQSVKFEPGCPYDPFQTT